jgi:hypothetical protein
MPYSIGSGEEGVPDRHWVRGWHLDAAAKRKISAPPKIEPWFPGWPITSSFCRLSYRNSIWYNIVISKAAFSELYGGYRLRKCSPMGNLTYHCVSAGTAIPDSSEVHITARVNWPWAHTDTLAKRILCSDWEFRCKLSGHEDTHFQPPRE